MWVVYRVDGESTVFADNEWDETCYLKNAERFECRKDAVSCASALKMTTGEQWYAAKYREAVRW